MGVQYEKIKDFNKRILGERLQVRDQLKTKSRYYIIIAQNKKERKEIEKEIKVDKLPYPKGEKQNYDMSLKGNFSCINEQNANEKDTTLLHQQLTLF